ncbi:beta strand repeat-containing protein [Deinococcus ruber]|uniref:beta strand repeat-containing protein n=1 Tax=Deinococcus ruber TaxID=1848197 RepID=UPI001665A747|nr:Ig-like domain-containing protein [Deinococcus ruber]
MLRTPLLWTLTGVLVACGGTGGTPAATNQPPEVSVKLSDGSSISTSTYLSASEKLTVSASDVDGSVSKVGWVLDTGTPAEKSGQFSGTDVKGKITLSLSGLSSGTHTLNLTVTDNQGSTGSSSVSFKVDAEAPQISTVTVNGTAVTEGQALTFNAGDVATLKVVASDLRGGGDTSASPAGIAVYVGDTLARTLTSPATLDLAALVGSSTSVNTIKLVGLDTAGNTSATRTFTVQFAAAATGGTTSTPVLNWLTPSGDFVRGNGVVALKATAFKDGVDVSSQVTYTASCGTISGANWTLGSDCADGSKQTITATVVSGGKSYSIVKTVAVDSSDPSVQITSPQQGQSFTSNPISVGVTASDAGSGIDHIDVLANGTVVGSVSSGQGSVVWAPQNGTYTLTANVYDRVGRTSTTTLSNIKVQLTSTDNAAPSVSAFTLPSTVQHKTVTATVAVTDPSPSSGIAKVELLEGSTSLGVQTTGVNGTYTFSLDTSKLSDGAHTLRAVVTDNVGLSAEKTGTLTTDNTAPVITWQSPRDGAVVGKTVTLNATTSEGTVSYTVDGVAATGTQVALSDGAHTLAATATDAAGNTTTTSVNITADGTAPTATILSPIAGSTISQTPVSVQVSASDALSGVDHIDVSVNGTVIGTVSGAQGTVTWGPSNGTYTINALAYDKAGNVSAPVKSAVTIATPAPVVAPQPVININSTAAQPYTGALNVGVAGNFDSRSTVSKLLLQIVDASGATDNTSYVSNQPSASFSVDTTKYPDGDLTLQAIALTAEGLQGKSLVQTVKIQNISSPIIAVTAPTDGSTFNGATMPVQISITKRNTGFTILGNQLVVDLLDYRGQSVGTKTITGIQDNASGNYSTSFDVAALPADVYTIRVSTPVQLTGGTAQTVVTSSKVTTSSSSVNPPAAIIRLPVTLGNGNRPSLTSSSGFLVNVSDNTGVDYVQVRLVRPDGTPLNSYLLNEGFIVKPLYADIVLPSLDIDGSQYVPDGPYMLRVTVADVEGNRNIQEVPVNVDRNAATNTFSQSVTTTPGTPDTTPGKFTYTSATWTLTGVTNASRVVEVFNKSGTITTNVLPQVQGNQTAAIQFGAEGTYSVDWIVEDLTTGAVRYIYGTVVTVVKNPT